MFSPSPSMQHSSSFSDPFDGAPADSNLYESQGIYPATTNIDLSAVLAEEQPSTTVSAAILGEEHNESTSNTSESLDFQEPGPSCAAPQSTAPPIDIQVRNVVCNYEVPMHINLREFALGGANVQYEQHKGHVLKQKRNPRCYCKIYSSGKVYIVGCRSEREAYQAARAVGRLIQRCADRPDRVRLRNYRVSNVMATCRMPFGIRIEQMAKDMPEKTEYEPELSPGLIWRFKEPKAVLRIHTTGTITVTGAVSESSVVHALSLVYPYISRYQCEAKSKRSAKSSKSRSSKRRRVGDNEVDSFGMYVSEDEEGEEVEEEDDDDFEDV